VRGLGDGVNGSKSGSTSGKFDSILVLYSNSKWIRLNEEVKLPFSLFCWCGSVGSSIGGGGGGGGLEHSGGGFVGGRVGGGGGSSGGGRSS